MPHRVCRQAPLHGSLKLSSPHDKDDDDGDDDKVTQFVVGHKARKLESRAQAIAIMA
jgi:hypothetical protein